MPDYPFDTIYDKMGVAMAYVPWQKFSKMPDNLEMAYKEGTIFPELVKPFTGQRNNPMQHRQNTCANCNPMNREGRNGSK